MTDINDSQLTGDFTIVIKARETGDSKNFKINYTGFTLTVEEEGDAAGRDSWRISKSTGGFHGTGNGRYTYADAGTTAVTWTGDSIKYDGKTGYSIVFKSALGLEIDTSANNGGYVKGYWTKDSNGADIKGGTVTDAGTYTTTVKFKGTSDTYTITWTIAPKEIDLSKLEWVNVKDGVSKYGYTGETITPSFKNLPEELTYTLMAVEGSRSGSAVGTKGKVTVQFAVADGYRSSNYVVPQQNGSYDGGFSQWTIDWEIVKAELSTEWEYKEYTDENGMTFEYLTLKNAGDKVRYEYYLTNDKGEILDENDPLGLDDIVVDPVNVTHYKVKAILNDDSLANYEFPGGTTFVYSIGQFEVGGGSTSVKVTLTQDEYTYTGKAVSLKWSGTSENNLNFTYYEGDSATGTALSSAPKNAGTYTVVIEAKSSSSIVLGGNKQFTFKIKPSEIPTEWNTSGKPPVLNLTKAIQLTEGIKYEYYNENMNPISYSDIKAGGTYYIRAVLKDNKNFVFVGDGIGDTTSETKTVQFSVSSLAELVDPSDIGNP
ncbi:MAG: hypothetical protein K2I23_06470, partial [Clostridia bacterium]|nr:hypothetical protein [Clostridia bacterium]